MMDGAASPASGPAIKRPAAHAWWRGTETSGGHVGVAGPAGIELGKAFLDRPLFETFAAVARRQPTAPAADLYTNRFVAQVLPG